LNSATGTPRRATVGANIAAGYTTDDVPMTRHMSQFSSAVSVNHITYVIFLKVGM